MRRKEGDTILLAAYLDVVIFNLCVVTEVDSAVIGVFRDIQMTFFVTAEVFLFCKIRKVKCSSVFFVPLAIHKSALFHDFAAPAYELVRAVQFFSNF